MAFLDLIKAGSLIFIEIEVRDGTQNFPQPTDVTSVTITVTDPVGVVKTNAAAMTRVTVGVYSFNYQSLAADTLGIYSATFVATGPGSATTTSQPIQIFNLN